MTLPPLPEDYGEQWIDVDHFDDDRPLWEQGLGIDTDDEPVVIRWACARCRDDDAMSGIAYCWRCVDALVLCAKCRQNDRDEGDLCNDCIETTMCVICGAKPRVSHGRCDTCRKYFARHGVERRPELAERQRDLNRRRPDAIREFAMSPAEHDRLIALRRLHRELDID